MLLSCVHSKSLTTYFFKRILRIHPVGRSNLISSSNRGILSWVSWIFQYTAQIKQRFVQHSALELLTDCAEDTTESYLLTNLPYSLISKLECASKQEDPSADGCNRVGSVALWLVPSCIISSSGALCNTGALAITRTTPKGRCDPDILVVAETDDLNLRCEGGGLMNKRLMRTSQAH